MKKSLKRVIACFLAVLMVAVSVPFAALADDTKTYGGDFTQDSSYRPNIEFLFNAFGTSTNATYYDGSDLEVPNSTFMANRGVKDMPLVWDQDKKQIRADSTIATNYMKVATNKNNIKYGKTDSAGNYVDYQLQAGDAFFMTIALDNVPNIYSYGGYLKWTGVEPTDIYSVSDAYTMYDSFVTVNPNQDSRVTALQKQLDEDGDAENTVQKTASLQGAGQPIAAICPGLKSTYWNFMTAADVSTGNVVYDNDNDGIIDEIMWAAACEGDYHTIDISSGTTKAAKGPMSAKNPDTGEAAYTFKYRAPLITYLFVVTDPDNVNFYLDTKHADCGFFTLDDTHYGEADTYNYNIIQPNGTACTRPAVVDFQGKNEFNKTTTYATVTFVGNDSAEISKETATADKTTYSIPDPPAAVNNGDGTHTTYTWADADGNAPTGTFGSADQTFSPKAATADHTYTSSVTKEATDTEAGVTTYTCSVCGDSYTEAKPEAKGHTYGDWSYSWSDIVTGNTQDANSAKATATRSCVNNDDTQTEEATVTVTDFTAPTEDAEGSVTFTATFANAATQTRTETIAKLAHVHTYGDPTWSWTDDNKATATFTCTANDGESQTVDATVTSKTTDATCTEAGETVYTATAAFDGKEYTDTKTVAIEALGHEYGETKITWNGYEATATQECVRGDDTKTLDVTVTNAVTKEATKKEDGVRTYTATASDGTTSTKDEAIPATGVNITVAKTDLGTVSGDIETNGSEVTKNFKFGAKYTVTASDSDNFLGWEVNGKLVTQEATYSSIAYTDITIAPVYKTAASGINVYFYDKYGNVFKSYEGVTADEYKAAVADAVPTAPSYPGYTFTGYDKSDDEIKANTENAIYTAQYTKAEKTYKVTATGATITVNGVAVGETTEVSYDTYVTVSASGAAGWAIDGKTVAYSESYSFYVGSDVTVTPVADVTVAPVVSIIDTTKNGNYHTFLATRASGKANIIQRGWLYGKNLDDSVFVDDLDAAKATTGVHYKVANVTASEQFALTVKCSSGTVKARAFIVDSQGNVYFSDIATSSAD